MPADHSKYTLVLPKSGGYKRLKSYQLAQLVYDITVRFVVRYIRAESRTRDQMEQAARSGAQNLAEGSVFSATSKKIEMNLTNVAKASLTELKGDYEDFLRHRKLALWPSEDPRRADLVRQRCTTADEVAAWVKRSCAQAENRTNATYAEWSANAAHVLCGVAITLIDRQLISQANAFEKEGGFNERLYRVRSAARAKGGGQ
ncbi:MAG: four helix bundle protein [Flavobacteriales bacterium]|nr:four helix bundle protein [Flavobacteriales bacterium]